MRIVCILLTIYWVILLVRIFSTWFRPSATGPIRQGLDLVHALTDPVLRPLSRMIPPIRLGAVGLDLSPIIVFVVIGILRQSIGCGGIF